MGIIEDFRGFINKHKAERGSVYTNTSIFNPRTSINVKEDEYDKFINLYSKVLTSGVHLHMTEKPTNPSPLRVDIDFRFSVNLNADKEESSLVRKYTKDNIKKIVDSYFTIVNKYVHIKDEENVAYVLEKSNPVEVKKTKIKDGIHIVFPHIILNNNEQHFIRKKILDMSEIIFQGLPICNEYESIIDKAIIDSNCWQMYGSRKPDCEAYRVTEIYKYEDKKTIHFKSMDAITAEEDLQFIKLFSMRTKKDKLVLVEEFKIEIEEYIKRILPTIDNEQKSKLHSNILFERSMNINKNYTNEEELCLAKRLVLECLSYVRAEKYDDWINLGWALRNVDYRLLDTWIEFSKIGSKFMEGECQNLWNKMRKENMGMGTLRWWAKNDNPGKYNEIMEESIIPYIDVCIGSEGSHYDVSKVVHAKFKDEFKLISKDIWYRFTKDKHRWIKMKEGLNLRLALSNEICKFFMDRACYWNSRIYDGSGGNTMEQKQVDENKSKICIAIALKLKNAGFKDSVMKECKCLFIDDKFEELLDSRSHLIGFENGVYDLKLHIFRDGIPDDYIYYSTHINYIPYYPNTQEEKEINDFFSKLFTIENVKKYILDILTCIIDGSIPQEKFYIFTGQGSNGKSRLLEFIQKILGDYYCSLPIALLTQKRTASNSAQSELERTKGRRIAVMQEPSDGDKINVGLMKELSGRDRILTRGLYKEPVEFTPQFKMFLACNELPEIPSDDGGTWRRIRVIEFISRFCENPTKENEFQLDINLSENFNRWAETLMSMLINRHKNMDPTNIYEPWEIKRATECYKSNNDVVGQFIADKLVKDENAKEKITIMKIYNDFRVWCIDNTPVSKKKPDRNQLKAYMEKIYGPYKTTGWTGIKYKEIIDDYILI